MSQGIPPNIYAQCTKIFMNCDVFNDDESLRSIFVTSELMPLRNSLPQANTKMDRVSKIIAFLYDHSISTKKSSLPHFIHILHDRYPGERLQQELKGLYSCISEIYVRELNIHASETYSPINLPFVILAMDDVEARELFDESIFSNVSSSQKDKTDFLLFKKALQDNEINLEKDIFCCYEASRNNWRPVKSGQSILNIIKNIITQISFRSLNSKELIVQPSFLSEHFFEINRNSERLKVWGQLGESGCVLIIDAVSLFHPKLKSMLSNSGLSSKNSTAILIISPLDSHNNSVNECIEKLINSHLELAFSRFYEKCDKLCEIGVGNLVSLQRWLHAIIPTEVGIIAEEEPNAVSMDNFSDAMGISPGNMGYAIAGFKRR